MINGRNINEEWNKKVRQLFLLSNVSAFGISKLLRSAGRFSSRIFHKLRVGHCASLEQRIVWRCSSCVHTNSHSGGVARRSVTGASHDLALRLEERLARKRKRELAKSGCPKKRGAYRRRGRPLRRGLSVNSQGLREKNCHAAAAAIPLVLLVGRRSNSVSGSAFVQKTQPHSESPGSVNLHLDKPLHKHHVLHMALYVSLPPDSFPFQLYASAREGNTHIGQASARTVAPLSPGSKRNIQNWFEGTRSTRGKQLKR